MGEASVCRIRAGLASMTSGNTAHHAFQRGSSLLPTNSTEHAFSARNYKMTWSSLKRNSWCRNAVQFPCHSLSPKHQYFQGNCCLGNPSQTQIKGLSNGCGSCVLWSVAVASHSPLQATHQARLEGVGNLSLKHITSSQSASSCTV
jgi:hypothetical protein